MVDIDNIRHEMYTSKKYKKGGKTVKKRHARMHLKHLFMEFPSDQKGLSAIAKCQDKGGKWVKGKCKSPKGSRSKKKIYGGI